VPASLTTFTNALKETYGVGLRNAINNSSVAWAEATTNDVDLVGDEAVWSLHTGRSSSTGARAENGTLPVAGNQDYIRPRRRLSFQYHTIAVSGPMQHLTKNDTSAFERGLQAEIKYAEKDLVNGMNRQVFGKVERDNTAYVTGALARVNGAPAANVITLDDTGVALPASIMRYFFVGMRIDAVAAGVVTQSNMRITAINVANRTITVDASGATADNNLIVVTGSYNVELDGLRALLSDLNPDGTNPYNYAGVTVASNPTWLATVVGSSTTAISEVILDEAMEKVETDGDGSSPKLFICEHVQRRKLASLLQAQKRYEGRQMTLTSGWDGLALARGATLVADRYCPGNTIFGIHTPELVKFIGLDFQWDEDDGEIFFKTDTIDRVEARYKGYVQLATPTRNAHVRVDLATPTF